MNEKRQEKNFWNIISMSESSEHHIIPKPVFEQSYLNRSWRNTKIATVAVLGFFVSASLLKIDIYTLAIGRLSPESYLSSIDSPRTGLVESLFAKDGQIVTVGDPILSYDCSPQKRQNEAAKVQLLDVERELATQEFLVKQIVPGAGGGNIPAEFAEAQLRAKLYRSAVDSAAIAAQRAESRISGLRAKLSSAQSRAELARSRYARVSQLNDRGFATRTALDEATAQLQEAQSAIELAQAELAEARAASAQARTDATSKKLDGQNLAVSQLNDIRAQTFDLRTDITKLNSEMTNCVVLAPATGQLFWISTLAKGAWLRSATPLAKVVPTNHPMIVEAKLRNQDIAFVRVNQKAVLKLDSLPYQRYGTLSGKVRYIAPDSVTDELGESFYKVDIEITDVPTEIRRELPKLISGMDAQVNIITEKRRLISYFFDPIIIAVRESFHER